MSCENYMAYAVYTARTWGATGIFPSGSPDALTFLGKPKWPRRRLKVQKEVFNGYNCCMVRLKLIFLPESIEFNFISLFCEYVFRLAGVFINIFRTYMRLVEFCYSKERNVARK